MRTVTVEAHSGELPVALEARRESLWDVPELLREGSNPLLGGEVLKNGKQEDAPLPLARVRPSCTSNSHLQKWG